MKYFRMQKKMKSFIKKITNWTGMIFMIKNDYFCGLFFKLYLNILIV